MLLRMLRRSKKIPRMMMMTNHQTPLPQARRKRVRLLKQVRPNLAANPTLQRYRARQSQPHPLDPSLNLPHLNPKRRPDPYPRPPRHNPDHLHSPQHQPRQLSVRSRSTSMATKIQKLATTMMIWMTIQAMTVSAILSLGLEAQLSLVERLVPSTQHLVQFLVPPLPQVTVVLPGLFYPPA